MNIFERIKRKVINVFSRLNAHEYSIKAIARSYDFLEQKDEEVYTAIYLKYIFEILSNNICGASRILDAGCGQGRISVPLAKKGYRIDAVDFTKGAVLKAEKYSKENGAKINFFVEDILSFLRKTPDESYDCVICLEVLYMAPGYQEIMKELARVIKKSGVFILSVRSKLFYVQYQVMQKKYDRAVLVAKKQNGQSINWFFNWYTQKEIFEKFNFLGMSKIRCYGIGVVSGIEGDPQSLFARPYLLKEKEREMLYDIELELAPLFPESGRYMLVTGVKTLV